MLRCGIVGLPNVGKSTLFNAVTRTHKAQAANYPFCTIEPNVGIVEVADPRLQKLAAISGSAKIVPAVVELADIAGLAKNAHKGEGLGNQFLAHIREADAIAHVVRCFGSEDIHHVEGSIDPIRDVETINLELILADMQTLEKRLPKLEKSARGGDKKARAQISLVEKLLDHLGGGYTAASLRINGKSETDNNERADESLSLNELQLLSAKPCLYVCNVSEEEIANLAKNMAEIDSLPQVKKLRSALDDTHPQAKAPTLILCAALEEQLVDLSPAEAKEYLHELAFKESGGERLTRAIYKLLDLESYLTTGEKETRAWSIRQGTFAPAAAGVIHGDFQRGFIAAECISYDSLIKIGSWQKAKELGKIRLEGKNYVVKDGDVVEFRFNV